ncbi:hypothetical protein D9M73_276580 [compost metagenome]
MRHGDGITGIHPGQVQRELGFDLLHRWIAAAQGRDAKRGRLDDTESAVIDASGMPEECRVRQHSLVFAIGKITWPGELAS